MVKICVTGNRNGFEPDFVFKKLKELNVTRTDIIISGGAEGVDSFAQAYAREIGAQLRIFYPNPDTPSPEKFFDRNEQMSLACDKMIAFDLNGEKAGSGTKNAINHAKKLGRELIVFESMEEEDMKVGKMKVVKK